MIFYMRYVCYIKIILIGSMLIFSFWGWAVRHCKLSTSHCRRGTFSRYFILSRCRNSHFTFSRGRIPNGIPAKRVRTVNALLRHARISTDQTSYSQRDISFLDSCNVYYALYKLKIHKIKYRKSWNKNI